MLGCPKLQLNEKVPFSCVNIAEQYEHEVNFTPPYHDCELQPIEEKISSKVIVGLRGRAFKNVKKYFESDENIQLIDEEFDILMRIT
ncbi:uncharacterized protein OCT59_027508 [Rhizophagus irregularis]|uniref:uncharacterized protein n=1 Tax=Rhizophagus irregularis TaxID=588596 RepID=UPI0019FA7C16|nr:hypothetical protein OCT59_027508 [Rhizophagus irregularis]GET65569.1 hypothetical protein RIR_jg8136.t1 [Rhizophagus irregularis DAOM 181602=DAOM 197198]